jgi:hypothetical protein
MRTPNINWTPAARGDDMHLDANESAFFMRELEYIKSVTYDVKYKPLKGLLLFPTSTEANTGASQVTWRQFALVGNAKIIADDANDLPLADTYGIENPYKVKTVGVKYRYTIQEIRESMFAGKRLDQRKAAAARRAVDQQINIIALTGDTDNQINGLINSPGIGSYSVPADGTGSSALWSSKTGDQINRDVTGMINAVFNATNGVEYPDTLLLPVQQYAYIATTRMTQFTDRTILEFLLMSSPFIKTVDWLPTELAGAGVGATNRMMIMARDDMHLSLEIPQPFEQLDPQLTNFVFEVPCRARTAGLLIYYPQSVAYGDGI